MKILSATQIKEADKYSIENEPISSIELMERAVDALYNRISDRFSLECKFEIYCGKGNNGGDGVALARRLSVAGYDVRAVVIEHTETGSPDFLTNLKRLRATKAKIVHLENLQDWEKPEEDVILIDAILGSGLLRPLKGFIAEVVEALNTCPNYKISVDIPTGLFADDNSDNDLDKVFVADWTLSLQCPKLSMMHSHTTRLCGVTSVLDIGLHPEFLKNADTSYFYLQQEDIQKLFEPRKKHTYKGTYGHALMIGGSKGSMGAAMMSSMSALRAGTGLLTVHVPGCGLHPMQAQLMEAMLSVDQDQNKITEVPDLDKITAVGIGPGMGTNGTTAKALERLLKNCRLPMVLDADALNILSENADYLASLPEGSILTPHPGEFKRLLGLKNLEDDYLEQLSAFSQKNKLIIVLKDSITAVADMEGNIYFIDEGSPALASPGSGDVLTGIILGLLSSGYPALDAAKLGVYLQGRAGTMAGKSQSLEAALARDVIDNIGRAFRELY